MFSVYVVYKWTRMNSKTYGSIILISERAAPSVLTLLFVLISAEHEIFSADKYENAN